MMGSGDMYQRWVGDIIKAIDGSTENVRQETGDMENEKTRLEGEI